ncbi:MAG: hypothetical protein HC880_11690 [Bacteroidia bacterium]|nr:hypothetical protein [Bacteroidia bacterium]
MEIQILGSTKDFILRDNESAAKTQLNSPTKNIGKRKAVLLGRPKYNLSADQHQLISQNYTRQRSNIQAFYTIAEELTKIQWKDLPGTENRS